MFLTLEDPRAKVKGSRDPLGVQPIWSDFGRHVVTNLTTVTTSIRGFTSLLLGRYFGERFVDQGHIKEHEVLPVFLRMEQIAAYARYLGGDDDQDILGILRVRKFHDEYKPKIPIQADASGMILSDQKTYGLWGLYTVSARASGLITEGPVGLGPEARRFVEDHYLPRLRTVERPLRALLLHGGELDTRKSNSLFKALCDVYRPRLTAAEEEFFSRYVRDAADVKAGMAPGRQALLARLLKEHGDLEERTGRTEILAIARIAEPIDSGLALALRRLVRLEALLAPAETVFAHLQARNSRSPAEVAEELTRRWGTVPNLDTSFLELAPEIESITSSETVAVMSKCDGALATGDYDVAVRALLDWNRIVMESRKAAPWIRLASGKLDVRYRGVEYELPSRDELPELWQNGYFINTLKSITEQLSRTAA